MVVALALPAAAPAAVPTVVHSPSISVAFGEAVSGMTAEPLNCWVGEWQSTPPGGQVQTETQFVLDP